jgi:predicted enzyme related to lactoylglutathione lyase
MLNFVVDDLEDALAQVVQAGGKPVGRIRDYSYGRFGWFMDPEGNKVELWEPRRRRAARPRAKPVQRRTK